MSAGQWRSASHPMHPLSRSSLLTVFVLQVEASDLINVQARVSGILLDIEGTTSSIRFVYDVLFPYARRELETFLSVHWDEPAVVVAACEQIACDAGAELLRYNYWPEAFTGELCADCSRYCAAF